MGRSINVGDIRIARLIESICIFLLVFGLLKPDSLEYIGLAWLDGMLMALDVVALVAAVLYALTHNIWLNRVTVAILVMWLVLGICTALNSNEWLEFVKIAGPASLACLLTDCFMQRDPLRFLRFCAVSLAILYTINFATIIFTYPEGLYNTIYITGDCYFMGYDNGMPYGLIPMCGYAMLYCFMNSGCMFGGLSLYCFAISFASVFYVQAITGIITLAFFLVLIFLLGKRIKGSAAPAVFFITFFVVTFLFVIMHIQTYFAGCIEGAFGKDVTLSGRTYLWDYAIGQIKQAPLIGTGATIRSVPGVNGHFYPHPHCLCLDLLLKGGGFMLAAFIVMMYEFHMSYCELRSGVPRVIVLCCIASLLLGEVTGSTQFKPLFWGMFALIPYCSHQFERPVVSSAQAGVRCFHRSFLGSCRHER